MICDKCIHCVADEYDCRLNKPIYEDMVECQYFKDAEEYHFEFERGLNDYLSDRWRNE